MSPWGQIWLNSDMFVWHALPSFLVLESSGKRDSQLRRRPLDRSGLWQASLWGIFSVNHLPWLQGMDLTGLGGDWRKDKCRQTQRQKVGLPVVGTAAPQKLSLRTERQGYCILVKEELLHTDNRRRGFRYTAGSRRWVN